MDNRLKLTIPWESIEKGAQDQIRNVLTMPQLKTLAIMPDVHAGYDLCIGGVALLEGVVCPSFVGFDIGCGMGHINLKQTAQKLGLKKPKDKEKLFKRIAEAIPAGVGETYETPPNTYEKFKSAAEDTELDNAINSVLLKQLGTLGGGNHFLEIGENSKKEIGITIHSGSRRIGYNIAQWYINKGRILALDSDLGKAYLQDMQWATDFAYANRLTMLTTTLSCFGLTDEEIKDMGKSIVNEHHNFASINETEILHRKGATSAEKDQLGIIPANQRDGVYITKGLGNKEFLCSASHGAGRKMNRKDAKKKGSVDEMSKLMGNIICYKNKDLLDEAPWAYKPIDAVLKAQHGIVVDVIDHFTPIIVLKGKG
jgi:tRNA-splicing ligase RtcB